MLKRKPYRRPRARALPYKKAPLFRNPRYKLANPTVNFVMVKKFKVLPPPYEGLAPQVPVGVLIDASTPFNPIRLTGTTYGGTWIDEQPSLVQPPGIESDLYTHYEHLVVNGCVLNVMIEPDSDASATFTIPAENDMVNGTLHLCRSSETTTFTYASAFECDQTLRNSYGNKYKNFKLQTTDGSVPYRARSRIGYSNRRQFGGYAKSSGRFWVANDEGNGYKACSDPTFFNLFACVNDVVAGHNLKPFRISIQLSYNITFIEPTSSTAPPLPLMTKAKQAWNYQSRRGAASDYQW